MRVRVCTTEWGDGVGFQVGHWLREESFRERKLLRRVSLRRYLIQWCMRVGRKGLCYCVSRPEETHDELSLRLISSCKAIRIPICDRKLTLTAFFSRVHDPYTQIICGVHFWF